MYIFGYKGFIAIYFIIWNCFVGLFLQNEPGYWSPQRFIWVKIQTSFQWLIKHISIVPTEYPLFFWHIYARNIYLFNVFSLFCTFQILDSYFKALHLKENLVFRFKHFIIYYLDLIFFEHGTFYSVLLSFRAKRIWQLEVHQ